MDKFYNYDEILKVKHAFLTDGEKTYFLELLNDPKQRNIHFLLRDLNSYLLFERAQELIEKVNAGEFDEHQMAVAEYKILHYLAAISEEEEMVQELYILPRNTKSKSPRDKLQTNSALDKYKMHQAKLKVIEDMIERTTKTNKKDFKKVDLEDNKEERQF